MIESIDVVSDAGEKRNPKLNIGTTASNTTGKSAASVFSVAPGDRNRGIGGLDNTTWLFVCFLICALPLFFLISYNSGYGYDQLEYLVTGRSLAEGYQFYYWIPSKSFGIYTFVAICCRLGGGFGHFSTSVVITLLFLAITVATFKVVAATENATTGLTAAVLVALCAVFMELIFLEPEPFVYLSGLAVYYLLLKNRNNVVFLFLAGLALGIGMDFKSIAAFYAVGAGVFLLLRAYKRRQLTMFFLRWMPAFLGGFIISVGAPAIYFASTGRWTPFWRWSVIFPLFQYPRNSVYLSVLYTKLLFINSIVVCGFILSFSPGLRQRLYSRDTVVLALLMGGVAYIALLKTQASHYYFPGASFFCIFVAIVLNNALAPIVAKGRFNSWQIAAGALLAMILMIGSVALYRPVRLKGLFRVRDFAIEEGGIARFARSLVPENKRMLITKPGSDTLWYWVAHRYPPRPFINTDQKTAWFLREQPQAVLDWLNDPDLVLVEFNPKEPAIDDPGFGASSQDRAAWNRLAQKVEERFVPFRRGPDNELFWHPR